MSPGSVVVTGANRGIGLGLIHQFLKDQNIRHIIATARDVEKASELNAIKDSRLHILSLSVTCDESIDAFVLKVGEIVGDNGLNLLVNNAGVFLDYVSKSTPNRALLTEQLAVNTVSVVILTQKLLPLLRKAASNVSGDSLSISRSAVITISSLYGSISLNTGTADSPDLAYKLSKTAVNQFNKTFTIDLKDDHILFASISPGWVQTDMGGKDADLTVEQSTGELVAGFYKLGTEHNGGFFDRNLNVNLY